jgi:hypothetical protein
VSDFVFLQLAASLPIHEETIMSFLGGDKTAHQFEPLNLETPYIDTETAIASNGENAFRI